MGSQRAALALMGAGLGLGLLAGFVVFVGWPLGRPAVTAAGSASLTPAPAPVEGAPAPDFTLSDLGGNSVRLSSLRGEVVLINFWATWCAPCRLEMPGIEAAYQAHQADGLRVLAVNLDESPETVGAFVDELGLTFTVLLDPGYKVNDLYRVRAYPTTYVVDRDGVIAKLHLGYMDETKLAEYLAGVGLAD